MIKLHEVIPWGRSYNEYVDMFSLTDSDLTNPILGCADGPASFNAIATQAGTPVISCDPLYQFSGEEINQRIQAICDHIVNEAKKHADRFVWDKRIRDPQALKKLRLSSMQDFLRDYGSGKDSGRYVESEMPALPFDDRQFDLALCSHFLFLYSDHLSFDFHLASLREMLRVANEARIFPVLDLQSQVSAHLHPTLAALKSDGFSPSLEPVPYEFQRGANQMLRIQRNK